MIEIHTYAGDRLMSVINRAALSAVPCFFKFNGIEVQVRPGMSSDEILTEFDRIVDERQRAWQISPEGQAYREAQRQRLVEMQAKAEALNNTLPQAIQNMDTLIRWLVEYAETVDYTGVRYSREALASDLERAGYVRNEFVGTTNWTSDRIGRWIIGQALDMLREPACPGMHPGSIGTAAERYFESLKKS